MRPYRPLTPGTCVKFRGNPLGYLNKLAIVVEDNSFGGITIRTEGADNAAVARHEISVVRNPPPRPLCGLRHKLPYGKWTCAGGREVLFNRDYKPIWQRRLGGPTEAADPLEWVNFTKQEWFYDDNSKPWKHLAAHKRCNQVLLAWALPPV